MILSLMVVWVSFFVMLPLAYAQGEVRPVAAWLFDEGLGQLLRGASGIVTDSSGNGHDGEIVGTPRWRWGRFGAALQFGLDPSDIEGTAWSYIKVPHHPDLALVEFTMTAWIKVPDIVPPLQSIVGKVVNIPPKGLDYTNYFMWISSKEQVQGAFEPNGPGNVSCGFFISFPSDKGVWIDKKTEAVTDDKWHFVACAYEAPWLVAYVDGKEVGKKENKKNGLLGKPHRATEMPLYIGARPIQQLNRVGVPPGTPLDFEKGREGVVGLIDDVALFDTGLPGEEIKSLMELGLAGKYGFRAVNPGGKLATTWAKLKAQ
jgi:hypothetical protein